MLFVHRFYWRNFPSLFFFSPFLCFNSINQCCVSALEDFPGRRMPKFRLISISFCCRRSAVLGPGPLQSRKPFVQPAAARLQDFPRGFPGASRDKNQNKHTRRTLSGKCSQQARAWQGGCTARKNLLSKIKMEMR